MPIFIVLTIIIVVVVLIAKSIHDARQDPEAALRPAREPRPARTPRPHPRPRRPTKPIDEAALAEHVTKLREAIAAGLVTTDEAVASICRFTEGVLSEDAARELLRRQGAA